MSSKGFNPYITVADDVTSIFVNSINVSNVYADALLPAPDIAERQKAVKGSYPAQGQFLPEVLGSILMSIGH